MKIIITGGGTGGHIYPAIAIADHLQQTHPQTNLLFVGAEGKMEMQHLPAAGYPILGLPIRGMQSHARWQNLTIPWKLTVSLWKAYRILQDYQPDVVVGTGGYASAPTVYVATLLNIPTLIQEQNAYAGLTNRWLAPRVRKIAVAYTGMDAYFPKEKITMTGNPVRRDIVESKATKKVACNYLSMSPKRTCLLILGGSQGAHSINQGILTALPQLMEQNVQLIWITGPDYLASVRTQIDPKFHPHIKTFAFVDRMDLAYAAADIVVARGGALSIAELCIVQKPTILVPSPYVKADHQTQNVQALVAQQAAIHITDQAAQQDLGPAIINLLHDTDRRKTLAQNMKRLSKPNATADIVALIQKLA